MRPCKFKVQNDMAVPVAAAAVALLHHASEEKGMFGKWL
jgi:hypothetical protein